MSIQAVNRASSDTLSMRFGDMRRSAIRQLAAAAAAPRIAAAMIKKSVQIWDLSAGCCSAAFATVLDFGGRRLALSPRGEWCAAANWRRGEHGGIACYDTATGARVWHRRDIRHTQRIRFSTNGTALWCGVEDGRFQVLDAATGRTVDALAGVRDLYDSRFGNELLLKRAKTFLVKGSRDFRVRYLGFGILDAAFGPDHLCVSEPRGALRCFDLKSGKEIWRAHAEDRHFINVWYRESDSYFYGVELHYRGARRLVRLASRDGAQEEICVLDSWEECFCGHADALVTSSGSVLDLASGRVVKRLAFPETDYPDG